MFLEESVLVALLSVVGLGDLVPCSGCCGSEDSFIGAVMSIEALVPVVLK